MIEVNKLEGAALDWAVAQCEGLMLLPYGSKHGVYISGWHDAERYAPSMVWNQDGCILQREKIGVYPSQSVSGAWTARPDYTRHQSQPQVYGPTPLVAAMRCYALSKMGAQVDVPEELLR